LQKQKNITNEADCIYYAQSTDPVRWVGGFCEDDEFSVDFDNIPAYVDTIVLLAMTQKCRNTPQPTLRDVEFEITLMDLAGKQIARHTTIVAGPRLFCDIFRILRDDDGWRITSPGIQLYKTIEDRLQVKP
jgi:stress response protein SCP2